MGLKEEKKVKCHKVFTLFGPKGGLCVGFWEETPAHIPHFDVVHICILSKEDVEKTKETNKCYMSEMHSMTAEEAMRLGASLIQAAGFYKASVGESLKAGFYADKWE